MARSWQEMASQQVEQMASSLRELFSSGLVFLHSELGVDLGLKLDLYPPWVILLTAWLGLCLVLILGVSVCRGIPKRLSSPLTAREMPENTTQDPTKGEKLDEPKKKSRKKANDKKPQRNGLAVEPQPDVSSAAPQGQDPPEVKADKAKKNKKKAKAPAKSSRPAERKDQDEAGNWETKVSNREKRQRRKDKGTGDGSGSPGGPEPVTTVPSAEQPIMGGEETKITIPSKSNTKASSSNMATCAGQRKERECATADVSRAALPPGCATWEAVLPVNGSSWRDLGVALPTMPTSVRGDTWNSMTPPTEHQEPTHWPQEMEGSWMIVDGSHIPVSLTGPSAAVEAQAVPGLSWSCASALDEWSGLNSGSADPASDWSAPCEEWGNYEAQPPEGAVSPEGPTLAEMQESDTEKDNETTAPGSSKAKKKKKKKKKLEEAGPGAQEEGQVGLAKDHDTAGNTSPKTVTEQERVVTKAAPRPAEPKAPTKSTASPAQRKPEDSWESPKQVKKKKARRET